jgi:hypothetical protein
MERYPRHAGSGGFLPSKPPGPVSGAYSFQVAVKVPYPPSYRHSPSIP